jgi:hypothetical protein
MYTLGRFIDPTAEQPSKYYLTKEIVMTTKGFTYGYLTKLSHNNLIVDDSLLPMPMYSQSSGIRPNPASIVDLLKDSEETKIIIENGN